MIKNIVVFSLFLLSSCGLLLNSAKPGPDSKRSVQFELCMHSKLVFGDLSSLDEANDLVLQCALWASLFSDDPLDCSADRFDRFLQETYITPVHGCNSPFLMRE